MKKIEKGDAPEFFSEFVAKEHPVGWDDVGPVRQDLRKHILREQYGLCAYTEIRITSDEKCHIDHFGRGIFFPERYLITVTCWLPLHLTVSARGIRTGG